MAFTRYHDPLATDNWLANSRHNYAVDTGATNSANVVLDPVPLDYYSGFVFRTKSAFTNTGNLTVNVNGLGNKTVFANGATASSSSYIQNRFYEFLYDGTNLHIMAASDSIGNTFSDLVVTGNTTLGDSTADSVSIRAASISLASGTSSFSGEVLFNSIVTFASNASVLGGLSVSGTFTANGNSTLGDSTADSVTVKAGTVTLSTGQLFVGSPQFDGNVTLGSATGNTVVLRAGTLTLATGQQIDGAATLNGLATFASNAAFQKTITASNASFNGNVEINGNLTVGDSTADSIVIKAASITLGSGTSSIQGEALFNSIVTFASAAKFNGAVTLGDATADTITVAGQIVAKGTAGSTGQALLSGGPSGIASFGDAGLQAATQAEMESASSTTVAATPGRTQYHPGVCKAWAYITGTVVTAGYNVASVTTDGSGGTTVNLTNALSSASYCVVAVSLDTNPLFTTLSSLNSSSQFTVKTYSIAGIGTAPTGLMVAVFGDQ